MREQVIADIVGAKTTEQAVAAIKSVMKALHLNSAYGDMVRIQGDIQKEVRKLRDFEQTYESLTIPRNFEDLKTLTIEVGFLRTIVVDKFVSDVNMLKVLLEESKTEERDNAMKWLADSPDHKNLAKSSYRDYLGAAPSYKEWLRVKAITYGNYRLLEELLKSIDGFRAVLKTELYHISKIIEEDVK